jgi:hypothetical protein
MHTKPVDKFAQLPPDLELDSLISNPEDQKSLILYEATHQRKAFLFLWVWRYENPARAQYLLTKAQQNYTVEGAAF